MDKFTSSQKKWLIIALWFFMTVGIVGNLGDEAFGTEADGTSKPITMVIGISISIVGGIGIYNLVNFDNSNDELIEERQKKEREEKREEKKRRREEEKKIKLSTIDSAMMVYHGGGLIDKSKSVKVIVTKSGLRYGPHSIHKDNIESFRVDTQSQMSTHVKQRVTATRMVLLGPFALAAPKSKTTKVDQVNKFLGVDYVEHGQKYTLILEGDNAARLELALRKMKSNNNVYE